MYLSEVYGKGGIYAKVVAASIANDIPIYTLETNAPKFIDAEFEKHRMLSSNSSSSRAIPFKQTFKNGYYLPFDVRMSQPGMQGVERLDAEYANNFRENMEELFEYVFNELDDWSIVHKQHRNRYLEPWMFQKKVITGTEWSNFFELRLAEDAQPEIQELARCMKEAMDIVDPKELAPGGWHLPYVLVSDSYPDKSGIESILTKEDAIKCSVARCARVSYMNHDNTETTVEKDLALYDMLLKSKHLTPMEHQASPMEGVYSELDVDWEMGATHQDRLNRLWSGNFLGWVQYRQLVSEWN